MTGCPDPMQPADVSAAGSESDVQAAMEATEKIFDLLCSGQGLEQNDGSLFIHACKLIGD